MSGDHDKYLEDNLMMSNGYHLNERGQRIDRFDLEQAMMNTWQVVDDLGMLYNNIEKLNEDQLMGAVDGLKIYANMRQQHLWDTYEALLHNERQDRITSGEVGTDQGF